MDYWEFNFNFMPGESFIGDLLSAELAEIGFESFEEADNGLKAYIPVKIFDEACFRAKLDAFSFLPHIPFTSDLIKAKNWNEEWEKNYFQPIVIGDKCVVHSTFHKQVPSAQYRILIDPKMAFGTGHHETTSLMAEYVLEADVKGKSLLDMGCGTAILAILASKKGARPVIGIDIDEWAYNNAAENIRLNNADEIEIRQGGAELLGNEKFDVVLANINRNILLQDMPQYVKSMNPGSELYMSGFYEEDIDVINENAEKQGLKLQSEKIKNRWAALKFELVEN